MKVSFLANHIKLGDSLQKYATGRILAAIEHHLPKSSEAGGNSTISFTKEGRGEYGSKYTCKIIIRKPAFTHTVKGEEGGKNKFPTDPTIPRVNEEYFVVDQSIDMISEGTSDDIYAAFDEAMSKLEKQLRKYKSKIVNHHARGIKDFYVAQAIKSVINPNVYDENGEIIAETHTNKVNVIAEKEVPLRHLLVDEAVMIMDLENLPALMFINRETNRHGVVYHRKDGNISWIESK